ncbi:MAG: hypothetical protein AB1758_35905, partial [Candidatus Eremiobacterota bacterium]
MRDVAGVPANPSLPLTASRQGTSATSDPSDTVHLNASKGWSVPVLGKLVRTVRTLSRATGQSPLDTVAETLIPILGVALASAVLPQRAMRLAQRHAPGAFQALTSAVVKLANEPVERGLGLNLQGALEAAALLDAHLAPDRDRPSPLMEALSNANLRGSCFVYLGRDRGEE